jgi:hypothetical protein
MGQLSATSIYKAIVGLFSSLDSTDETLLKNTMLRFNAVGYFTDGGTAGTAQTETAFWTNDTGVALKVTSVKIVTPIAVTANGTNFMTASVAYRTSAGGGATTIGSQPTSAVSLTAFAPTSVSITAGNDVVPVGGVLTIAMSKSGTGVAVAAATSQAYASVQLEPVI